MKTVRRRARLQHVRFFLRYARRRQPGAGLMFPCDEQGVCLPEERSAASDASYQMCLTSPDLKFKGVTRSVWSSIQPAVGQCECGRSVELYEAENDSDCGRLYSQLGKKLRHRPVDGVGRQILLDDEGLDYESDAWDRTLACA